MSKEQPPVIWLIDTGDCVTWCDCPDPSDGIDPEDVTGPYVLDATNRIAELEADFRIQNATIADQHDEIAKLQDQLSEAQADAEPT